jgi:hypothetical protein
MPSGKPGLSDTTKKNMAVVVVWGFLGGLVFAVTPIVDTKASDLLVVIPNPVGFKATVGKIAYGMVTIVNSDVTPQTIVVVTASPRPPFWPTWGGTCNSLANNKVVPGNGTCTFQFGFKPATKGVVRGTGEFTFKSGIKKQINLTGTGE